ncbi:MAG: hypothetical protein KA319_04185 [Ferruginibacter sp.]|nr:hypothetical protein [Ferruginibacter sp.]
MSATFEAEKNRKAFLYTAIIIAVLLLIAFFVKWSIASPPKPIAQDLIEINLGNFDEGDGEIQPLIKGDKAPDLTPPEDDNTAAAPPNNEPAPEQPVEDNNDEDAAPVNKPEKPNKIVAKNPTPTPVKTTNTTPATNPTPKPQKPKYAGYGGQKDGKGNGATEDNGYTMQGNKPGGKGDAGDPNGNPNSNGKDRGGTISGPQVTKGARKIISVRPYSFTDDLEKATIYAIIRVNSSGKGTFIGFDKGSTQRSQIYANAISRHLNSITFAAGEDGEQVTVRFNIIVN